MSYSEEALLNSLCIEAVDNGYVVNGNVASVVDGSIEQSFSVVFVDREALLKYVTEMICIGPDWAGIMFEINNSL